jgi:hypothetical protein
MISLKDCVRRGAEGYTNANCEKVAGLDGGCATLAKLPPFDGPKVVFCAGCLLGGERLDSAQITVRQTPYEIRIS